MAKWTARVRARLGQVAVPGGVRRSTVYVADLEALRGVAIALVVVFHYAGCIREVGAGTWVSPIYAFVSAGHTGVSLFFILSAFLLSPPFLRQAAGGPPVSLRDYFGRRALRILPLYYSAVFVASLLCVRSTVDLRSTVASILFVNLFEVRHALMPYGAVWWSLSTEVQFYLVLPLLPVLVRRGPGRFVGVMLLLAFAVAYAGLVTGTLWWPAGQYFLLFGLLGRGPLFLYGIGLAWLYERYGRSSRPAESGWLARVAATGALALVLLALGYLLRWVTYIGSVAADGGSSWWHIPEGALWSAVMWLLLTTHPYLRGLFANVFVQWFGVISYSIYIVHYPLMDLSLRFLREQNYVGYFGWTGATAGAGLAIAAFCLAVSALTYRFVELPFLRRKALLDR